MTNWQIFKHWLAGRVELRDINAYRETGEWPLGCPLGFVQFLTGFNSDLEKATSGLKKGEYDA